MKIGSTPRASEEDLTHDAHCLESANADLMRAEAEGNSEALVRALDEFLAARKRMLARLVGSDVLLIGDPRVRAIIDRVRNGEPYPAETLASSIEAKFGVRLLTFDEFEIDQIGSDSLYSWISHVEYVEGMLETSPLVADVRLPSDLVGLVSEARQCFAFQQYTAVVALCRTILEGATRDAERGRAHEGSGRMCLDRVLRATPSHLKGEVKKLYGIASDHIHGKEPATRTHARDILARTLHAVTAFYDRSQANER